MPIIHPNSSNNSITSEGQISAVSARQSQQPFFENVPSAFQDPAAPHSRLFHRSSIPLYFSPTFDVPVCLPSGFLIDIPPRTLLRLALLSSRTEAAIRDGPAGQADIYYAEEGFPPLPGELVDLSIQKRAAKAQAYNTRCPCRGQPPGEKLDARHRVVNGLIAETPAEDSGCQDGGQRWSPAREGEEYFSFAEQ